MTSPEKTNLITRNTEEILTRQELVRLVKSAAPLKHYIGFEISGKVHLGTGIACMAKVKDFADAGAITTIFLADWHAWMNEKLGGDFGVIGEVAAGYFKEALKASFLCIGGDPDKLEFVLGSDLYHNNDAYWQMVIGIAKHTSRARVARSISILGRKEGESGDFAKLIYPVMQAADIFALGANLVHAGTDQRKAHVIARHAASHLKVDPLSDKTGRSIKPVAVHHHLLLGLGKPPIWPVPKGRKRELFESMKMSKSKPDSAVFIHDSPDEIRKKVMDAFCPPLEVAFNPILDWAKWMVFPQIAELKINRAEKHGGPIRFTTYRELEKAYEEGKLHPEDLKIGMADWLIEFLKPARQYFEKPRQKEYLARLDKLLSQP